MSGIQIFKSCEFGNIRAFERDGESWFVGRDVANALGYANVRDALAKHVDEEDKGVAKCDTLGGTQALTIINESGLYSLILSSNLPSAKKFKRWITNEVIPTIRKTGGYSLVPRSFAEALRLAATQQEQIEKQQKQLEAERPKVAFADAITSSGTSCLVGELAKLIKQAMERAGHKIAIGQNRFFQWLRDNGFLGKSCGYYNVANQEYVEQGLFELKKTIHDENGVLVTKTTTKVTGKGQAYFINGFLDGRFCLGVGVSKMEMPTQSQTTIRKNRRTEVVSIISKM